MKTPILFSFLLFPFFLSATHILGGTIMYTHLGGSSYELSVRLYRDCNSVGFPATITLTIVDSAGNQFAPSKNVVMAFDSAVAVPSYLSCVANPGICIEEGFYTNVVSNLPAQAGGYHMYYQYCCRPTNLLNVVNPLSTGMSIYSFIPDQNLVGSNSSPRWNLRPPLFECQGYPMNYDNGATDADGDSLVFSYYTPYNDPAPTFPSNVATFTPITWVGGYGATNPAGGPTYTMNSATGYITGVPANLGWYQYGVICDEYRNGVKIAEIRRDYPLDVIVCQPSPMAAFIVPAVSCYGNTVQFQNTSQGATTYFWDFGDPSTTLDTSSAANPQWNYMFPGTYTVTLVADPYTSCADTMATVITVEQVVADFSASNLIATQITQFTDLSTSSDGAPMVVWTWDFGDATATSNSQNPQHTYANAGSYTVTLTVLSANGCMDTYTFTVTVQPVGITEYAGSEITLAPNPNSGRFTITLSSDYNDATLELLDVTGRCIGEREIDHADLIEMNERLAPGIYFVELIANGKTSITKMIVQ